MEDAIKFLCPDCGNLVVKAGKALSGKLLYQQFRCPKCKRRTMKPLDSNGSGHTFPSSPPKDKRTMLSYKQFHDDITTRETLFCPDCGSQVYKHGKAWFSNYPYQQYRCPKCKRSTTKPLDEHGKGISHLLGVTKRPSNKWERKVYNNIIQNNGDIHRNGYPDFFATINGHILGIEVKPSKETDLTPEQKDMMSLFNSLGVFCYKWTPEENYVPLFPNTPNIDIIFGKELS